MSCSRLSLLVFRREAAVATCMTRWRPLTTCQPCLYAGRDRASGGQRGKRQDKPSGGQRGKQQDKPSGGQRGKRQDGWTGRRISIASAGATVSIGSAYVLYKQWKARAETGDQETDLEKPGSDAAEGSEEEEKQKKHISFHDRKVMAYENRIRAYSTPDKIFRYFATLRVRGQNDDRTIYMTPQDFMRSLTPGMIQPQEWGLDLYRNVTMEVVKKEKLGMVTDERSIFRRLGHCGLISFSDYVFLLTILATPMKHFEIAFKMFDLNGDGEVEFGEFEKVRAVILNSTAVGSRHRDHMINGNVAGSVGGALVEHLFGANCDQKLTVEQFRDFHIKLNTEMLKMEFDRFEPEDGKIREIDFSRLILAHAALNEQGKKKLLKRVKREYGKNHSPGITFEEMRDFFEVLDSLSDMEMALSMYYAAGNAITKDELMQAAKAVANVTLSKHLVEVVFALFDENNDGELSRKEFITIMRSRTTRGLSKARELGFAKFVNAVGTCSSKAIKDSFS